MVALSCHLKDEKGLVPERGNSICKDPRGTAQALAPDFEQACLLIWGVGTPARQGSWLGALESSGSCVVWTGAGLDLPYKGSFTARWEGPGAAQEGGSRLSVPRKPWLATSESRSFPGGSGFPGWGRETHAALSPGHTGQSREGFEVPRPHCKSSPHPPPPS